MSVGGRLLGSLSVQMADPPADSPTLTPRLLLGTLGLVLFALIYYIDERLAAVGTSDLLGNFREGSDEGSWLSTAYTLGQVLIIPMTPWLGVIFSFRTIAVVLICIATVSAALITTTTHYETVMGLRLLQGVGEGGSVPLMLGHFLSRLPKWRIIEALVAYGLVITVPVLTTFSLDGLAVDLSSWLGLFGAAPIIGPIALGLVLYGLESQPPKWELFHKADFFGLFSLTASVAALVVACAQGQRLDWFDSGFIDALFVLFVWFGVCFVGNTWLHDKPLYRFATFAKINFSVGLAEITLFAVSLLGVGTLFPQEQADIRFLRPLQIGDTTLVLLLPVLGVAASLPFVLRRVDARLVLALGLFVVSLGAWLCVWVTPQWAGIDYRVGLELQASGWLMVIVTNALLTTGVLTPEDALTGSAMFNLMRTIGFGVGGAVVTAILTVRTRVHGDANIARNLDPARAPVRRLVEAHGTEALVVLQRQQAEVMAFADCWGWLAIAVCFALFLSLLLQPAKVTRTPG